MKVFHVYFSKSHRVERKRGVLEPSMPDDQRILLLPTRTEQLGQWCSVSCEMIERIVRYRFHLQAYLEPLDAKWNKAATKTTTKEADNHAQEPCYQTVLFLDSGHPLLMAVGTHNGCGKFAKYWQSTSHRRPVCAGTGLLLIGRAFWNPKQKYDLSIFTCRLR